jgi:hypothetical protein
VLLSALEGGPLLLLLEGSRELGEDGEEDEALLGSWVVAGGEVGLDFSLGFDDFVPESVELGLEVDHEFLVLLVVVFLLDFG